MLRRRPAPFTYVRLTREHRLFHSTRGLGLRTFVLAVAAIALMVLDHQYGSAIGIRSGLSALVYPIEWIVNAPAAAGRTLGEDLGSRRALLAQNRRLSSELLLANASLERLASLEQENARLRELLNTAGRMPGHVTVVSIMTVDLTPFQDLITLNAGLHAGIHKGQPILDSAGIVGQVVHAGPLSSQAMLITDPASAIPVEIARTGLATLAVGTGTLDVLDLPYLPNNADVKPGDRLVSSGLGGRYPRGYPVGVITSVTRQPAERFAEVKAVPAAHLGREHEVLAYFAGNEAARAKQP